MRRGQAFWGMILIVLGSLFLLNTLGVLSFNVWSVIGPVFLILLGLWVLSGWVFGREGTESAEEVAIPLEGAEQARLRIDHGLGRMTIAGGAAEGALLSGSFGSGLDYRTSRDGALLNVRLKMAEGNFPWFGWWEGSLNWDFGLSESIPLALEIDGGAGEAVLDLANTRVTDLTYDAGVGTIRITLPARAGQTKVKVDGGVGTIKLHVPEGVAARIKTNAGIGTISVDKSRFPATGEGRYQSPNYETAENKADIVLDGGVGTATIR